MTISRTRQICLEQTPYYHCVSRCVRRAFLCGTDRYSGHSYEHRREWVESLQALLDNTAVIRCMAYVDLNPVRAGIAETPETSDFTSLKYRLDHKAHRLVPFLRPDIEIQGLKEPLPLAFHEYLDLVDWTGRIIRDDKKGSIPQAYPPTLDRLNTSQQQWIQAMRPHKGWVQRAVGSADKLQQYCRAIGQQWLRQRPELRTVT